MCEVRVFGKRRFLACLNGGSASVGASQSGRKSRADWTSASQEGLDVRLPGV